MEAVNYAGWSYKHCMRAEKHMRKIALLAALAAFSTTISANGGLQPGQAVTLCDDGGAYVIVNTPEECKGTPSNGTITVVGGDMISIDMDGKNLIIDTAGKDS